MNDKPVTADEAEDAAFRARLAPLASEVLPAATARSEPRSRGGHRIAAIFAIGGAVAVLGAALVLSRWPWSVVPVRTVTVEPAPPAAAENPSAAMIGLLVQRGDAALADGDIIAARLLFERAAGMGSAAAATAAGKTYDIDFLLHAGARGIRADPVAAAGWFRKAAALGDPEAAARLQARTRR